MLTEEQVARDGGALNLACGPKAGPPLLFLHGVGRCWQDFLPLIPSLAWRWQIFALDFRGHGHSARMADKYLVRDYVRDAVHVIRERIARPVVVYGHSLGAMVAAATAAELPELVRAALLEDPPFDTLGPNIHETPYHSLFEATRAASGSTLSVDELAGQLARTRVVAPGRAERVPLGELRDAPALRFGAACLKRVDPRVWDPLLAGRWLDGYDVRGTLSRIACPTLLLQGNVALGGMLDDAQVARLEGVVPRLHHVRLASVGHLIHEFETATTLRLVQNFLTSLALETD